MARMIARPATAIGPPTTAITRTQLEAIAQRWAARTNTNPSTARVTNKATTRATRAEVAADSAGNDRLDLPVFERAGLSVLLFFFLFLDVGILPEARRSAS